LVAPEDLPAKEPIDIPPASVGIPPVISPGINPVDYPPTGTEIRTFDDEAFAEPVIPSVTISGRLTDKVQFMSLGQYFIVPFRDNSIEMEVKFKIKASPNSPLTESDQKFKRMKEAVKQLGFDFEIED
jgi:hypothetical protein